MKTIPVNNNFTFGNTRGGVKYLQIIKDGDNLHFVNTTKEMSDVGVFVAGGSEIDRKVRDANVRVSAKSKGMSSVITKRKPKILTFISKLFRL